MEIQDFYHHLTIDEQQQLFRKGLSFHLFAYLNLGSKNIKENIETMIWMDQKGGIALQSTKNN